MMRFLLAMSVAVLSPGCAVTDANGISGGQDITAYISGPWRAYMSYYSSPSGYRCDVSTTSTNSLPVRAFFRSRVPKASVTTDTRTGERDGIAFYLAYQQAPDSRPVVSVNGKEFKLRAEGEWAYPPDVGTQAALLKAMKGSSVFRAMATLRSSAKDGTQTEDNFGLEGFEKQLASMNGYCLGRKEKSS